MNKNEITLVWRTDTHLADQTPKSRTDDWTATVLGKLEQVGQIAREVGAVAVIDGGDFFHIKSPGRTKHALIQKVAVVHAGYPCPVFALVGNHDVKHSDEDYLDEAPLGVLFSTTVFRTLSADGRLFKSGDLTVRVAGISYHGREYDQSLLTSMVKGEEDYLMVAAHLLASQAGGEMYGGEDIVKYNDLVGLDPDVWCFLPGTMVLDWNGRSLPIEGVYPSMSLMGRNGSVVVEEVHPSRHVREEVVSLDVEGVPSGLIPGVTLEHPFWATSGLKCYLPSRSQRRCHPDKTILSYPCSSCFMAPAVSPKWVAAGELREGDYVSIPVPVCSGDSHQPGLARLLGLYLAEGHIILNREGLPVAGVGWSFHKEETRLHSDVEALVRDHFGLVVKHHHSPKDQGTQLCAYGKPLAEFFHNHGGRYSHQKQFSAWVWTLSATSRMELLVGWLDGDGHARNPDKYDRVKVEVMGASVSPRLVSQLFELALSLGLRPYYTIRPEGEVTFSGVGGNYTSLTKEVHILSFYGDDAVLLGARMGVVFPNRAKTKVAGFFHGGLFWRRIRGVSRRLYDGPVYNMRTSTQEYTAGLLLTHNCFGHWHKNQGVTEVGGKQIVNIGSLTRGSLSQDDTTRIPEVAILRFTREGVAIERRELDVQPVSEVFDLEGKVRAAARSMTVDSFVKSVQDTLSSKGKEPLLDTVRGMDIPEVVKERVILLLEEEGAT